MAHFSHIPRESRKRLQSKRRRAMLVPNYLLTLAEHTPHSVEHQGFQGSREGVGLPLLAVSGALLRSIFLLLAAVCGLLGYLQLVLQMVSRRFSIKLSLSLGGYDLRWEELPEPVKASTTEHATAVEDSIITFIPGGRYWVTVAIGFLIAFAFPSSKAVLAIGIAALFSGLHLTRSFAIRTARKNKLSVVAPTGIEPVTVPPRASPGTRASFRSGRHNSRPARNGC